MEFAVIVAQLITLSVLPGGHAYPGGSPPGVCVSMVPGHGLSPLASPPPFLVSVSNSSYSPGSKLIVTLTAPCGLKFKGFMLQARRADSDLDQSEAIGSFNTPAGTRSVDCGSGKAASHSDRNEMSTVEFVWTAPFTSPGHVVFKATVLQDFSNYWTDVFSKVVVDKTVNTAVKPGFNVYPSALACPTGTPHASKPTTTTRPHNTTRYPTPKPTTTLMHIVKDSECGNTKGCASDCQFGDWCSVFVSWKYYPGSLDVHFELAAVLGHGDNQWMAIGFSDDTMMGNDSVAECVAHQGQIDVYSSFNEVGTKYNRGLINKHQGVRKNSASLVDGIFRCSFERSMDEIGMDFFNLWEDRYLLFASGHTEMGSDRKMKHVKYPTFTDYKVSFFMPMEYSFGWVMNGGVAQTVSILSITFTSLVCISSIFAF